MTYRQIEASREIRLWIGQVIVPIAVGIVMMDDDRRAAVKHKFEEVKNKSIDFVSQFRS